MKVPKYRVEYTPVDGSATNIDVLSLKVSYGIENVKDVFSFKLIDKNNSYEFDLDDTINIYLHYVGEEEVLVMNGIIEEIGNTANEKNNITTIKGASIMEVLLNHQLPADYDNQTADFMIQNLLARSRDIETNPNKKINWDGSNSSTSLTKDYHTQYKPLSEHLEVLSSNEYTGDGQYIYYLDMETNSLIWKAKSSFISGTIDYGTNTISQNRTKSSDETLNFIIVNCGKDMEGASIHTYKINTTSIGKYGARYKYEVWEEISNELRNTRPDLTGNNQNFRDAAIEEAKLRANKKINLQSKGINKDVIIIPGSTNYSPGDKFNISLPHSGWTLTNRKELRLMEVEHNFDKSGWWTTLSFEEDV